MEVGNDDSIKVFIRVRPSDPNLSSDLDTTQLLDVSSSSTVVFNSKPDQKVFTFDHVAGVSTTQEEVFSNVGRPIIDSCMCGYNGTIFAYGQTGSGKTFTMIGPPEEPESFSHELRGVIPRGFEYLFSHINHETQMHGDLVEYLCKCSFLEIYNEQVFDLLESASSGLLLRENMHRGVFVDGLSEQSVASAKDAYDVLSRGWLNRRVASTSMNRESSRSHAVFTLTIESKRKETANGAAKIRTSLLNLVDLAGSERQRDTNTVGLRLKEAGSINKSLSALGNVIMALVDIASGKSRHVHYRDSKLTFLLRDSLGGNAKTYLIACVHPSARCFGETLSTLNFARRAKMIKNKAVINENTTGNVLQLQAEIRRLRALLDQGRAGVRLQSPSAPLMVQAPSAVPAAAAASDGLTKETKEMLQSAMQARERAEGEKMTLLTRIEKLEELSRKKDKFLQSTKLILKLRENHIGNLEKAHRNAGLEDLQTETLKLLGEEMSQLRQKVDHHPEVTRYAMECMELKSEVKRLRESCAGAPDLSRELSRAHQYTLQLERQLRHFLAQSPDVSSSSLSVPPEPEISVVDLQAKCQKLQKEVTEVQHALSAEKKAAKKQSLKMEASLVAAAKANAELERTIEALKLKNVIEKDTLNNMHMKTIKSMMTPQRARLKSCHSVTNTPMRGAVTGNVVARRLATPTERSASLPTTPSICHLEMEDRPQENGGPSPAHPNVAGGGRSVSVGVNTEEMMPNTEVKDSSQYEVAIQGALTDELKVLQDEVSSLQKQLEAKEEEVQAADQERARLEAELQELGQVVEEERAAAEEQEGRLVERVSVLTAKVADLTSSNSMLDGEQKDLRSQLQSAEQELYELRQTHSLEADSSRARQEEMERKMQELELSKSEVSLELERATEQLLALQDHLETLQDEVSFKDGQQAEYDALLRAEKEQVAVLEEELQAMMEKLSLEVEKNLKLQSQLEETGDSKKELLGALTEISTLRSTAKGLEEQCTRQSSTIAQLEQKCRESEARTSSAQREAESNKEALSSLMACVQEQKALSASHEAKMSSLEEELKETEAAFQRAQDQVEQLHCEVKRREEDMVKLKGVHHKKLESVQLDNDMLADDLEHYSEQNQKLHRECETQAVELDSLREQVAAAEAKLSQKEGELSKLSRETKQTIEEIRSQSLNDREEFATSVLASQDSEIAQLREKQSRLLSVIEGLEAARQERNEEIAMLKLKESECASLVNKLEVAEARYSALEYRLRADHEEHSMATRELERQVMDAGDSITALRGELEKSRTTESALMQDKEELLTRLRDQEEAVSAAQEMQERCRALEQQSFSDRELLASQLSTLQEEKARLEKECSRLLTQNNRLIGQNNTKQRIQYHAQVKMENNQLKEENARLQARLKKKSDHTRQLELLLVEASKQKGLLLASQTALNKENMANTQP